FPWSLPLSPGPSSRSHTSSLLSIAGLVRGRDFSLLSPTLTLVLVVPSEVGPCAPLWKSRCALVAGLSRPVAPIGPIRDGLSRGPNNGRPAATLRRARNTFSTDRARTRALVAFFMRGPRATGARP